MLLRLALILAAGSALGCSSAQPIYTADGSAGHSIDCSGLAQTWNHCLEQAGALCKEKGYTVVSQTGEREGPPLIGSNRALLDLLAPTKAARSMVIKCNEG